MEERVLLYTFVGIAQDEDEGYFILKFATRLGLGKTWIPVRLRSSFSSSSYLAILQQTQSWAGRGQQYRNVRPYAKPPCYSISICDR